ncbi:MAG: TonB-dependent receptor plug domain-containing protein [Bacteroidia bacterium]
MKFLKIIFIIGFPIFSYAQSVKNESLDSTKILQEVTVTATRQNTAPLSTPYSTNSIQSKDILNFQFRTTPEALVGNTGVFIQKTNHGGGSPFIRGLTGNQILLMIDGIRVNNSTFRYGPNQYFNLIDVYSLSKIEVVRGTGSVQYGSDALGGVIQVFTKEPVFVQKKKTSANVQLKAVSQNMEYTGHGEILFESKKIGVIVGATWRDFGDLYGGDTTGKQSPSGYSEQAINGKIKFKVSNNSIFSFAYQYLEQKDVPLFHRVKLENFAYYNFAPQQRQMAYAKLEQTGKTKWLGKTTFIASLQQSLEKRSYMKNGNDNYFIDQEKVITLGLTVDILSKIRKNWTANSGFEYYHDKVNSNKTQTTIANDNTLNIRGLYPDNSTNGNFSVYSLHHINLNRFTLETGLRYNNFKIHIPDTTTILKVGEVNVSPSSLVGNLALLYHLSKVQSIYSSFSTSYRIPNIDDMGTLGLVDFRYEIPAYTIKPEKTYNTEIGYRASTKRIETSIAFFYMHLADLITRVQVPGEQVGGYNVYIKENSQESYIRGIEGSFDFIFLKYFTLKTNASYCYGQNLSKSEPMRRIPPFNGRISLSYTNKKWQASAENIFAGKQNRLAQGDKDDNRIPKGGTPGWNVINIYGSYSVNRFAIRSGLQNILNTDYRTHGSGINGMGRSVFLSLQINL